MNENPSATVTASDKASHSPGVLLEQAREARGLSQEYIATRLNLGVHVIVHLEMDNYVGLPEPVYIKGYIRAYARLLGIDADLLIERYLERFPDEPKVEKALWQPERRPKASSERAVRWLTAAFVFAVVLTVGLWWEQYQVTPISTASEQPPVTAEQNKNTTVSVAKVLPEEFATLQKTLSLDTNVSIKEKRGG